MAFNKGSRTFNESQKFRDAGAPNTKVATTLELKDSIPVTSTTIDGSTEALDVAVKEGEFVPTGLTVSGLVTTLDVGDTAQLLPTSSLSGRNSLVIRSYSSTDTLYIGFNSSVTADLVVGSTSGFQVPPLGEFRCNITDDISVYGITETGVTVRIQVVELA